MNRRLLIVCLLLLIAIEILRGYFIMPFPGSQHQDTIGIAYWLNNNVIWIRIIGLIAVMFLLIKTLRKSKLWAKILFSLTFALYAVILYLFNFRLESDKIFYQPNETSFASSSFDTTDKTKLIIGIVMNGEAKAYPIQIIGYHHQVRDTISNTPVIVTYCTVCHTGRVYSPLVNGKDETFRLVGMDHFNAIFEDKTTKSWWQQATGIAVAGPLKGAALKELPSTQLPLGVWLRQYPNSLVMQPDMSFHKNYEWLADYDDGNTQGYLVKRDFSSWKSKSWIIGIINDHSSKAYDWNELVNKKIIQDSIAHLPILLTLENDANAFHAYDRRVDGLVLRFQMRNNNDSLIDDNTKSTWNMDGLCIDGALKGKRLIAVQAYNEFWHSWQTFHKATQRYLE
jgi:hypothetical protein